MLLINTINSEFLQSLFFSKDTSRTAYTISPKEREPIPSVLNQSPATFLLSVPEDRVIAAEMFDKTSQASSYVIFDVETSEQVQDYFNKEKSLSDFKWYFIERSHLPTLNELAQPTPQAPTTPSPSTSKIVVRLRRSGEEPAEWREIKPGLKVAATPTQDIFNTPSREGSRIEEGMEEGRSLSPTRRHP